MIDLLFLLSASYELSLQIRSLGKYIGLNLNELLEVA